MKNTPSDNNDELPSGRNNGPEDNNNTNLYREVGPYLWNIPDNVVPNFLRDDTQKLFTQILNHQIEIVFSNGISPRFLATIFKNGPKNKIFDLENITDPQQAKNGIKQINDYCMQTQIRGIVLSPLPLKQHGLMLPIYSNIISIQESNERPIIHDRFCALRNPNMNTCWKIELPNPNKAEIKAFLA